MNVCMYVCMYSCMHVNVEIFNAWFIAQHHRSRVASHFIVSVITGSFDYLMYVCMYVCMRTYIYIYIYVYIHMYTCPPSIKLSGKFTYPFIKTFLCNLNSEPMEQFNQLLISRDTCMNIHLCMYICMSICTRKYVYKNISVYGCKYVCIHVCMYVCMYICVCVCVCVYVCMCQWTPLSVSNGGYYLLEVSSSQQKFMPPLQITWTF